MEARVHGNLETGGLEVIVRSGRYFVRYDAGSHQMAWREDELALQEFERLRRGKAEEYEVLIALQRRLIAQGEDPHTQNWLPPSK